MQYKLCQESRLEALYFAQAALFNYLKQVTAFFCPKIAQLLVSNIRDCLNAFKAAGIKKVQLQGFNEELLETEVANLIRLSRTTSRFLTRSKRAQSFNRLLKLLSARQRHEVRQKEISLLEIDIAWRTTPKVPLSKAKVEELFLKDARRVEAEGQGHPVALADHHNDLEEKLERDRLNVEESIKKEQ